MFRLVELLLKLITSNTYRLKNPISALGLFCFIVCFVLAVVLMFI